MLTLPQLRALREKITPPPWKGDFDPADAAFIASAPAIADQLIEMMEDKEVRLKYCEDQNGRPYCKNCGLE